MLLMTRKEFATRTAKDGSFRRRFQRSTSPGPVAVRLGVSRQRVHKMLEDGILDGLKVIEDGEGHHPLFIVIFDDSVEARERHHDPRKKFALK
jgi:hypothetical protein